MEQSTKNKHFLYLFSFNSLIVVAIVSLVIGTTIGLFARNLRSAGTIATPQALLGGSGGSGAANKHTCSISVSPYESGPVKGVNFNIKVFSVTPGDLVGHALDFSISTTDMGSASGRYDMVQDPIPPEGLSITPYGFPIGLAKNKTYKGTATTTISTADYPPFTCYTQYYIKN